MPNLRQYIPTHIIIVFSLSLILTLLYYSFEAGLGFEGYGLSDEGFQWYGSVATAKGEVPVRDFRSYDPGRYYWLAAWSLLLGDGIKAHRLSMALFQAMGLFLGLLAIRRMVKPWWGLLLAGLFLILWMHPRHKLFEHSIAMMGIFFAVWLLENPSLKRHFVAGIFVGLAAFIGRNHGLYNALALFLMVLAAWHKVDRTSLIKKVFVWGCGIIAGYSPLLLMILLVPDFWDAFWSSIVFTAEQGNIPRPVPWFWTLDWANLKGLLGFHSVAVGVIYMLLPVIYIFSAIMAILSSKKDFSKKYLLIASAVVGFFYMHHAFGRAGWSHLAQAIHPMLICIIALPSIFPEDKPRKVAWGVVICVCAVLALAIVPMDPLYGKMKYPKRYKSYKIGKDSMTMPAETIGIIDCVVKLDERRFKKNDGFLVIPVWPGLYPILKRSSPVWDIFFTKPASDERQRLMIGQMKKNNVRWIILGNTPFEGKSFKDLFPLMNRYINANYSPAPLWCLPLSHRLLKKNK